MYFVDHFVQTSGFDILFRNYSFLYIESEITETRNPFSSFNQ